MTYVGLHVEPVSRHSNRRQQLEALHLDPLHRTSHAQALHKVHAGTLIQHRWAAKLDRPSSRRLRKSHIPVRAIDLKKPVQRLWVRPQHCHVISFHLEYGTICAVALQLLGRHQRLRDGQRVLVDTAAQ